MGLVQELRDASVHDLLGLTGVFFETAPFAAWVKAVEEDGSLRMIKVNVAFERIFEVTVEEYAANQDGRRWGQATFEETDYLDQQCVKKGIAVEAIQIVRDTTKDNGPNKKFIVRRWPVTRNGRVVAMFGASLEVPHAG